MKALKYLTVVLRFMFLLGCQKELSYESISPASGSLKDTLGNCLPVTINGTYFADSTLTDSNFVTVQVRISVPGSYAISTDSANGFSFSGNGTANDTGLQSIKLTGIGKPLVSQITNFSVAFDSSVCNFSVNVETGSSGETAVYTLESTSGNCANSNATGTYQQGTPLNSSNIVSLQVKVDTVGTYFISAGPVNGMAFSVRGTFASTGLQTVTLVGSGTPVAAGNITIPVVAGGSNCSFNVVVAAGDSSNNNPNEKDSAWQFGE